VGNKMSDLREHLFETLQALKDKEKPMDLERAKAVAEIGQTIINSAKVEVDYLKVTGQGQHTRSEFFPVDRMLPPANGKAAPSPEGKNCHDCRGEQKETAATHVMPGGTAVCTSHFRKRAGMAATV
jgi:hypothetical protein